MSLVQDDGCDDLKYRPLATLEGYGEFRQRGHNTRLEKLDVMRRLSICTFRLISTKRKRLPSNVP
jgi:hypothetical protein